MTASGRAHRSGAVDRLAEQLQGHARRAAVANKNAVRPQATCSAAFNSAAEIGSVSDEGAIVESTLAQGISYSSKPQEERVCVLGTWGRACLRVAMAADEWPP